MGGTYHAIRLSEDQNPAIDSRDYADDEHEAQPADEVTYNTPQRRPRWQTAGAKTLGILKHIRFFLPSYLHRRDPAGGRERKLHPTAYLDALRGYAAVCVFIYHAFHLPNIWFLQLPIIRVFFDGGSGMVAIFFVISGYVLSYRMLQMIRNKQAARLHDCLASSTFRRFIRLYGSTGVATLVAAIMVTLRWYIPYGMNPQPTVWAQMWDWFLDFAVTCNPFADIQGWVHDGVFRTRYLDQMWTIPIEYRGSIILFVFCAASSKLSTMSRWIFLWIVVALAYWWRAVYVAEFLFGMFVADLSLSRHPERLGGHAAATTTTLPPPQPLPVVVMTANDQVAIVQPEVGEEGESGSEGESEEEGEIMQEKLFASSSAQHRLRRHRRRLVAIASTIGWVSVLLLGFILLGQPDRQHTPDLGATDGQFPWPILARMIPPWYGDAAYTFWISFGAFFVVLALDSCPILQRPFEWRFSQYLGDLSFGIYAMHWPIVYGPYRLVIEPWRAAHLGESHLARLPGALLTALVVLWVADYFTRVDKMVVRSARWLQNKTFIKWD
ncbi:hypothetical protein ABEF91_005293 [Exophiala dermatitidis]